MKLNFYNVCTDAYHLYEVAKQNDWFEYETYDDFLDNGGDLQVFEGDPDMIKINGETGYFFRYGDDVFYYFDDWSGYDSNIEGILRDFYTRYRKCIDRYQSWDAWKKLNSGIAYRGGAGYVYCIFPLKNAA